MPEAKIVLSAVDNTGRAFAAARQGLSGIGSAAASVKAALTGIGAVAAAGYLANMIGETKRAIDGFKDLSDATGSSVENVSALDRVARASGGTFEQVSGTLIKFNQVLQEADPKTGVGAVLKSLSLDIEDLKKLDPAEALRRTAVALAGYADDGEKARAVQVLFGRSVREIAPFLKDLAESGKLVGTVTTQTSEDVDRFGKQLSQLQANTTDVGRVLSIDLIQSLSRSSAYFLKVAKDVGVARASLISFGAAVARTLGMDDVGQLQSQARANQNAIALTVRQIEVFQRHADRGVTGAAERVAALRAQYSKLQAEGSKISDGLKGAAQAIDDEYRPPPETETPKPPLKVPKPRDPDIDGKRALADAERARLAALKEMERTLERIAELSAADVQRSAAAADSVYESNQALREEIEYIGLDDQARFALLRTKEQEAIKDRELLLLSMQSAGADAATIANLEREINLRRQRAGLLEEQGVRVQANKDKELERDRKKQEEEDNKRRSESLSASIEDGILNGFRDGKSGADIFLQELKAQFGRAVLRPIIDPIVAGGMSGIGSLVSGLLKSGDGFVNLGTIRGDDLAMAFDGGGYTGNGSRSGGLDGKGGFMAMLHPQETVIDHTKGQSVPAQPVSIVMYNTNIIGSVASQEDVAAGLQAMESRIYATLSRSARYGGAP